MAKKSQANPPPQQKTKRRKSPAANKRAGNNFELEIIKKLKEIGYDVVSSRSESKATDNNKIDVYSRDNKLPVNLQLKYTQNTPDYFGIRDACTDKNKPFGIIWKKHLKDGRNSPGTIIMLPLEYFLELIKVN